MVRAFIRILFALLAGACGLAAQNAGDKAAWKKLEFLLGDWGAVGGSTAAGPGQGEGAFSFKAELNGSVIVRRNRADYDVGAHHDDLMVIYAGAAGSAPRAIYFDSEGHVIQYDVSFPSADCVVLQSESAAAEPRYRLTYRLDGSVLAGKFEISVTGEDFKTYLTWTSRKER